MISNLFYFNNINAIGGVETFFYELVKKYQKYDITILYKTGDQNQIKRLSQYAIVRKYTGGKVYCKKAFFNYNMDIIDNVIADEYIAIIHTDYSVYTRIKPPVNPKITKYIGVSQRACDAFTEITGIPAQLCYNPITIDKAKDSKIKLISATRLSIEKGKDRMIALANALDRAGVNYTWTIYTTDTKKIKSKNIIYKAPNLNVREEIAESDFTVQLSDCESYCYTVVESLCLGVPVICTPLPVLKELGVNESNSIILPFDMKNIPIDKIKKNAFKFTYEPPKDSWDSLLDKALKSSNAPISVQDNVSIIPKDGLITVKSLPIYRQNRIIDADLGRVPRTGETWRVTEERLKVLLGKNMWGIPLVEVIEK